MFVLLHSEWFYQVVQKSGKHWTQVISMHIMERMIESDSFFLCMIKSKEFHTNILMSYLIQFLWLSKVYI